MRWIGLTLLAACSFRGPQLGADANGAPDGNAITADASQCVATEVVASKAHTCAMRADGYLWCWGGNDQGESGTVPIASGACPVFPSSCVPLPMHVALPAAASAIALGATDTCAIAGATTYCWGADDAEEFGDSGAGDAYAPRAVPLRAGATAAAIGVQHVCSIDDAQGHVECSGHNARGEVGDNSNVPRAVPTRVMGILGATALGLGDYHGCAIVSGQIWCWGDNEQLQLAPDRNVADYDFPVAVPGIATAVEVAGGDTHTCARLTDGTVRCWGAGGYGQLGNDTFPIASSQVISVPIANVVAVRTGNIHTCALDTGGGVSCWGAGLAGHPIGIPLAHPAISLAAGGDHDCAALTDGSVWCWGSNDHGQLGDGTTTSPLGRTTAVRSKLCL